MRWLCAQWLRFRSAEGFSYQLAAECVLATPELRRPVLSFLILLSFSLCRPAELDLANPFLSLFGGALNHVHALSFCAAQADCMWSLLRLST